MTIAVLSSPALISKTHLYFTCRQSALAG